MASRRKASTPCMIRPDRTLVEMDDDGEDSHHMETSSEQPVVDSVAVAADGEPNQPPSEPPDAPDPPPAGSRPPPQQQQQQPSQQGGYECKYCPFSTQNLNAFKEHVDASHPNVILNPLYLCAVCNFNTKKFDSLTEHNEKRHPGEINFKFKRVKLNNQTVLEQTIEGCSGGGGVAAHNAANPGAALRNGQEPGGPGKPAAGVKFAKPRVASASDIKRTEFNLGHLTSELKKPITAVSINGAVLIPEATLLKADSPSHIMPSLQRPPNFSQVPKIAVPLNTTKYNPSLDGNLTLMSSFNKFPYPTQAELSWLTAASKHPEEQIKVWFTTQRLKQGISWSPEEVEEARKKMFNGTISSAPGQTFTVLASSKPSGVHPTHSTTTSCSSVKVSSQLGASLPPLPCHLLGQTSLVLTPVANGSTVSCAPLALTLTNQVVQSLKRPLPSPMIATGIKRPSIIQTIQAPLAPTKMASPKLLSFTVDPNKTAKQLSLLRHSYTQCPFPEEDEIYRLIETTGLSRGEIKKWFSEQRLLNIKGAPPPPVLVKAEPPTLPKEVVVARAVPSHFPLLERVKGKSSEQLTALEESFQRSGRPSEEELDQLARDTKLSQTEVDCWFSERRALRDNMEKALLNMGGAPRAGTPTERAAALEEEEEEEEVEEVEEGGPGPRVNGAAGGPEHPEPPILCPSSSSSSSSSSPPVLVASSPHPPPALSASASPPVLAASAASPSSSSSPRPPVLSASTSPAPISGRCLALLREVFSRTQWPSPEEYSQLEAQTALGRTDIVRWFKEHRAALKSGQALEWMEGGAPPPPQQTTETPQRTAPPEQNGRVAEKPQPNVVQEARILKALGASEGAAEAQAGSERSKLSGPELVQWFTDRLGHSVSDLSRTRTDQTDTSIDPADKESWVKVMVAVGEESDGAVERAKMAAADTEKLPLEQPGRVTG